MSISLIDHSEVLRETRAKPERANTNSFPSEPFRPALPPASAIEVGFCGFADVGVDGITTCPVMLDRAVHPV